MSDNRTTELLPCPFCGGEVHTLSQEPNGTGYSVGCHDDECRGFIGLSWIYKTEAEAVEAWNTRAPVEYDGWFYLPKPKESIVQYGAQRIEKTETGYRAEQPVEVIESAIRSWGDKLGEHIMKRICEVWYTRAELGSGTCEVEKGDGFTAGWWVCQQCGTLFDMVGALACNGKEKPNYCPNCRRKVER